MRADLLVQDGSPAGFVLLAMENAQLPRPQQAWGLVVFEQEAASVLKRHDEVSAGSDLCSIARSNWCGLADIPASPRRHCRIPRC
jgi:hypothetical protein